MKGLIHVLILLLISFKTEAQVNYSPPVDYPSGPYFRCIAIADFNGDGVQDLAATAGVPAHAVYILLGNGDGTFAPASIFPSGSQPQHITTGDFNNDGNIDFATVNWNSNIWVSFGTGTGSFGAAVSMSSVGYRTSIITADFNGDGNDDLATSNYNANDMSVFLGNGNGTFAAAINYAAGTNVQSVVTGDFNNNLELDLIVSNYTSQDISYFSGIGNGTFTPAVTYNLNTNPGDLAVSDFNMDGDLDLAIVLPNSDSVKILLGNGSGQFIDNGQFMVGDYPVSILAEDLNGNGFIDLVITNSVSDDISVLLGDGSGAFSFPVTFATGIQPFYVNGADFNGDGEIDLAVANYTDADISIYLTQCQSTTSTDAHTACDTYDWIDGNTYTANNSSAQLTLTNSAGCDSVVTLDLTINYSNAVMDVQTACNSYTWIDGNTYTANNSSAQLTLTNSAGCDSVVTLDLTINYSNAVMDVQTACNSYTWIDGNTYTANNSSAQWMITNTTGCDSLITLDLTINYSNTVTDVQTACNSYTWIDGNTYTTNNSSAQWMITNTTGCDSLITLDLTINYSNAFIDVQTVCNSYTWIDGNTYTTDNNSAQWTLTNSAGCDSLVTLDLTINYSNAVVDVQTACNSYTWIDGNTYIANNNAAQWILTNSAGCDSVVTLDLTISNTDVTESCSDYFWSENGQTYSSSGNYVIYSAGTNGCDSAYLFLIINEPNDTTINTSALDSYNLNGVVYNSSGFYSQTLVNENGCDSTINLNLVIMSSGIDHTEVMNENIIVYPNPTTGLVTISGMSNLNGSIDIVDNLGKHVPFTSNSDGININHLSPGVYYLSLESNDNFFIFKLIKK